MRSFTYAGIVLVLLTTAPLPAAGFFSELADDFERVRTTGLLWRTLDWENDAFTRTGGDRYYTNGIRFTCRFVEQHAFVKLKETGELIRLDMNSQPMDVSLFVSDDRNKEVPLLFRTTYGMHFGQNMYTSGNITLPPDAIDPNDRPYGAWLYAGLFKERYDMAGRYWRYGLDVGCIGPCAQGERTQKFVHEIIGSKEPRGWGSQSKTEPGVVFHFVHRPAVYAINDHLEASPLLTANIGNIYLNGSVGGMVRIGRLSPIFYGRGFNPGINPTALAREKLGLDKKTVAPPKRIDPRQLFLFLRFDARLVAYNALLEGGLFRSNNPHEVDSRPVVFDTEVGAAWLVKTFSISYSVVMRSTEVRGQDWEFDQHKFGRIQIGCLW